MKILIFSLTLSMLLFVTILAQEINEHKIPVPSDSTRPAATPSPDITKVENQMGQSALTITKMVFCTEVEQREPQGEAADFPASVGKLYFWTDIKNANNPMTITHVWYHNNKQMAKIDLPVKFARNRVWSVKSIPANMSGSWKVVVLSASGDKLGELNCTIK